MKESTKASLRSWTIWLPVKLIRFYQLFLSPYMGKQCRYTTTCTNYALEA